MKTSKVNTFYARLLLALTGILFSFSLADAQGLNSAGTDYWVGFMPNFTGGVNTTQLHLASGTANNVQVTVNGTTTNYTLGPNQGITADLGGLGVTTIPETPGYSAVHVTATAPLTMYGYNVWTFGSSSQGGSPDGYLALPTSALGRSYYTVNYYDAVFGGSQTVGEFVVIVPYDSTIVTINPKAHTRDQFGAISHNPAAPWSFMLMKGQTYLVQSTGNYTGVEDLTGSSVTSSKPVALISGHQIAPIDYTMSSADHLLEMVPPVDVWGTQYFEMPMAGRTKCGDLIRILSAEDGNKITINGGSMFSLNAGEWRELHEVLTPEVYTSINQKKFIVAQYSYSLGFDGDPSPDADPFLILFTPQENFEKRMIFRTPLPATNGSFVNYLTVIARKDSINNILINGQRISTAYKSVGLSDFPGTSPQMSALRIQLPDGTNTYLATANVPFGMYQYGFAPYEGYGWPTGEALNIHSTDTLPPLQTVIPNCGTIHVHLSDNRSKPAYSFEDTHIAEVDFIAVANDPRWSKPSTNFTFTLNSGFSPGDSSADFVLQVTDLTKSAYAAVYTVDRAGNDTVYTYTYTPLATPVITVNFDTLHTTATGRLQWFEGGLLLPGDTSATLVASQSGNYSVRVEDNFGCVATSIVYTWGEGASVSAATPEQLHFMISPNPFSGVTYLDLDLTHASDIRLEVLNLLGESVATVANGIEPAGHLHLPITLGDEAAQGTYFVRTTMGGVVRTMKIVLQK